MTAVGFLLWILPVVLLLKQEDEIFWNHYKKTYRILSMIAALGFVLFCLGIAQVLWKELP